MYNIKRIEGARKVKDLTLSSFVYFLRKDTINLIEGKIDSLGPDGSAIKIGTPLGLYLTSMEAVYINHPLYVIFFDLGIINEVAQMIKQEKITKLIAQKKKIEEEIEAIENIKLDFKSAISKLK